MKFEWQDLTLGDIVETVIDYRGKTPKKLGGDWSDTGYRAFSAKNIKTGQIVQCESIRFVDEAMYHKWMKEEIQRGDILITSEAPFGQIFYWDSDEKIVLSQRLFGVRIKKQYDSRFVYYYMTTNEFQSEMDHRATGTTVVGLRQPELMKCALRCPDYETQRKISAILTAIDNKIAVNEAINHNLQQQADAIFAHEFLELPAIPPGWTQGSLLDIANYQNGLAMQKYRPKTTERGIPVLKIKELRQGVCDDASELCSESISPTYIVQDGDVIFSWSGTLLVDFWCGGVCGLNQHLFKVTSDRYEKWFYYAWTRHHLQSFIAYASAMATTMGHIKRGELEKAEVLIPSPNDLSRIGSCLMPIYDAIISNRIENHRLIEIRDSLLPKLMSGEIDVSKTEI